MLLGKRSRPPMKRTTSMTEFAPDVGSAGTPRPSDQDRVQPQRRDRQRPPATSQSPRGAGRRNSGDFAAVETAAFLRACGLCNRRLGPGRDTFMYRGEIAFCSLECRQQQISLDEWNAKCSLTSMKKEAPHEPSNAGSDASSSSEMVAAA